jgi:hypothetical protein
MILKRTAHCRFISLRRWFGFVKRLQVLVASSEISL